MKTILVDAVHTFVIENVEGNFYIFQEMYNLLETFENRKIILTGATKGEGFEKYGLDTMPYEVFTLEHDPEKTDQKYYATVLQHFGLKAEDVVCFEHNPEAVKSAQSVGIQSYCYDEDKRDMEALNEFLIANLR